MGNNKIACTFILKLTATYILKKFIAILFPALLFTACESEENPLEFEKVSIERTAGNCDPEKKSCTFISLNFPLAAGEDSASFKINERIKEHLFELIDFQENSGDSSLEELAEDFIKNYEEVSEDFPEADTPWEATVQGSITYSGEELLSIKFQADLFTGGAHGYNSVTWLNFDPGTGKILTTEVLFTTEFREFAEQAFRQEQQILTEESINSTGLLFEGDRFHLPQQIGFTEDKVLLHYNAYEIASFSQGAYNLEFSRSEIREYLKIKP